MPDILTGYIIGAVTIAIGVLLGAFVMFKGKSQPGSGEGFIKSPKGEAFTLADELDDDGFPGSEEPSEDEKRILERADKFLGRLGE